MTLGYMSFPPGMNIESQKSLSDPISSLYVTIPIVPSNRNGFLRNVFIEFMLGDLNF